VVPSRSHKTEALVLSSRRLGEADRIVGLYTRERGRLSAVAKGIRRTKSRMGGRLEPFSLVHLVLYQGHGSLYTVTSVDTIRTFQGVRDSLFRLEEGAHLLEAVKRLFPEEEQNPGAFNLLIRGISALAAAADRAAAARIVLATRLKLLMASGYLPELDSCVSCGAGEDLRGFRPSEGGVLCAACFPPGADDCFPVSSEGLAALRGLLETPLAAVESLDMPPDAPIEVERILSQTLAHHVH
jgi:DNA repair protein RecO (recombination protein O)